MKRKTLEYVSGTFAEVRAKFEAKGWKHNAERGRFEKGECVAYPRIADGKGKEWLMRYVYRGAKR